jgi:hypothetical protein
MSDTAREAITDEMVEAAVKAHWAPRLHVNDTHHDRRIDMRAALEAALASQQPAPEDVRQALEKIIDPILEQVLYGSGFYETYSITDAILAVFDVRRKP